MVSGVCGVKLILLSLYVSIALLTADTNCASLNLSNHECYTECEYYNNMNLYYSFIEHRNFSQLIESFMDETNTTNFNETLFNQTIRWFTLSSSPYNYYGSVQPQMCLYSLGTYCNVINANRMVHGYCLPTHCHTDDATKVLLANIPFFQSYEQSVPGEKELICSILPRSLNLSSIIFIIICVMTLVFIALSTVIKHAKQKNQSINIFFEAFCIQTNWNAFIKTRIAQQNEWAFMDGMRLISSYWVLLYHLKSRMDFPPSINGSNTNWSYPPNLDSDNIYTNNWAHFIGSSFVNLTVDNLCFMVTFFFMSGMFGTFSMIKILTKWKYKRNYISQTLLLYFRRYLRLMVIWIFITIFNLCISDQIPYSYNVTSRNDISDCCKQSWYKELLMYNEIERTYKSMNSESQLCYCVKNGWYVPAVFQLSLYLPIVCFLWIDVGYIYGFIASIVPILACLISRVSAGFYYYYSEQPYLHGSQPRNGGNIYRVSYQMAWSWMANYYIGCLFVLILLYCKHKFTYFKTFMLFKFHYWFLQMISLTLMASYVFTPYSDFYDWPQKKWNVQQSVWYYVFGAFSYCIGLTVFIFCLRFQPKGYYSIIKEFLSCSMFQILSKLSYIIYLFHTIILDHWRTNRWYPYYFSWLNYLMMFFAFIIVVTFCSFLIWMFVENPIGYLVAKWWKKHIIPIYSKRHSEVDIALLHFATDTKKQNSSYGTYTKA
eukprot:415645_1